MASAHNKLMQQALKLALKREGFKKFGATWRKRYSGAIGVLNIQGSQWGPSFYVNLGIYFAALGSKTNPLEYDCHLRCRLHQLVPDRARFVDLLNFESSIPDDERLPEIVSAAVDFGVAWLGACAAPEGARAFYANELAETPFVTTAAREFIGLVSNQRFERTRGALLFML